MKTKTSGGLLGAGIAAAALWALAADVRAQLHPVIDTWGVNIGATTTGLGYITFLGDGTLAGHFIVKPTPKVKPANLPPIVRHGFTFIEGAWALDGADNVIGFFTGGSRGAPIDKLFFPPGKGAKKTTPGSIKATGRNGPIHNKGKPVPPSPAPGPAPPPSGNPRG